MSRKPAMTEREMRAHIQHLTKHNRELTAALGDCRAALAQQMRHAAQLARVLDDQPTPRRVTAC